MVMMAKSTGTPPGGVPPLLLALVRQTRNLLDSVSIAADVPGIRDEMVEKLVAAIREANEIAKEASTESGKAGGPSPKSRWYQVVGYLVQVLDGVCKNVELSEINERLLRVERKLSVAKSGSSQARRKS